MKVLIASDIHFFSIDNRIFVSEKLSKIFMRYRKSFGDIILCSRVYNKRNDTKLIDVTDIVSKTITFAGFCELYSRRFKKQLLDYMKECDLVIGRFESFSAIIAYQLSKKLGKPFFSEVMSDPWDGLWNHSFVGKMVAPYSYLMTKNALSHSDYALYVTNNFLQSRYPCPFRSVGVSNVFIQEVNESVITKRFERIQRMNLHEISLMTTGATYVKYKGQEYVIRAIPLLNQIGIKVKYLIVGEGSQDYLRCIAKKLDVEKQVLFMGRLPLGEVMNLLENVDIYIQPSLQEGLPRAVIEAMSRGVPCLGAQTAGIPELIRKECVFKRKSPESIFQHIKSVLEKTMLMALAKENYIESKKYYDDVLSEKREQYYNYVVESVSKKK